MSHEGSSGDSGPERSAGGTPDESWARLSALFDDALDQPPEVRDTWAREATADDPEVRDQLLRMLAAHNDPAGLLERPVVTPADERALRDRLASALEARYTIVRALGRGGMASVFLAHEQKHDRDVVIKVLDPEVALAYGDGRFHDEVRIAAGLAHPHILPLIDSGNADGLLYYVMPRIDGETMRERLRRDGPLSVARALPLLRDLADALAHAHDHGVIHRDLKPDNILCAGDHAYLLDFGVAKRAVAVGHRTAATRSGHAVGTPGYMSPEQASGQPVDARSDLYAWGLVATELLTGRAERGALRAVVRTPVTPSTPSGNGGTSSTPGSVEVNTGPDLPALVDQCLAVNTADRPASAHTVVALLDRMIAGGAIPEVSSRRALGWTLAAAAALAVVGVVAVQQWRAGSASADSGATPDRLPAPVAVAPLFNETGDSTLTVWGRLAGDWLTQGVEETNVVAVVPWTSVRAVTDANAPSLTGNVVQLLGDELGAATVVSGSYYAVGDSVRVQLAVTDATTQRRIGAPLPSVTAHRDSLSSIMRLLRERLQGFVALQVDDRIPEATDVSRVPPTYNAYRAFDRGLALFTGQQYREAAVALREANSLDTTFLAPLIYAAMAHWNTNEPARTDSLVRWLSARRSRLSPYAEAMTTHLDAMLSHDAARALTAIRSAAEIAPGMRAEYSVAHQALSMNQPDAAIAALRDVDPDRGMMRGWQSYWTQLAHAHHLRGDYAQELVAANEMRRRYPNNRAAGVHAVRALAAANAATEMDALLDSLAQLPANTYWSYGGALVVAADEMLEHGAPDRAARYYERAIRWFNERLAIDPGNRVAMYWLGSALYQHGDDAEAAQVFAALTAAYPDRFQYRGLYAVALARIGRTADALAALGDPPPFGQAEHTSFRARIAAIDGDTARASALLEQTLREGFTGWPWFPSTSVRDFAALREGAPDSRVLPLPPE